MNFKLNQKPLEFKATNPALYELLCKQYEYMRDTQIKENRLGFHTSQFVKGIEAMWQQVPEHLRNHIERELE